MNVYIEVENFGREMEARMLLAMEIAGENNQVFISDRMQILNNAAYNLISKGIIFLKDLNSSSEIYILLKKARGNGFTIIATDEEAGIQFDDYENFIKVRSIKNLDNIDFLIAWGLRDKKVIKKNFPTTKTRILALGSPRIDLCHENFLKMKNFFCLKKIIDEKYILISSNISYPISIRPMINSIFKTNSPEFEEKLPSLLLFFNPNCGACVKTKPFWDEVIGDIKEMFAKDIPLFNIMEVNLSNPNNQKLSKLFKVEYIPTIVMMEPAEKLNAQIKKKEGSSTKAEIEAFIKNSFDEFINL